MIKQLSTILTLNCRDAARLLSDRSERSLKMYERLALRFHLLICKGCRRFQCYLATIKAALTPGSDSAAKEGEAESLVSELDADARLSEDAKARLKKLLERA